MSLPLSSGSTRDRIIKKVKSKYWWTTHKFGIEITKSVEEAYAIDRNTGTSHWARAIDKEMQNMKLRQRAWIR